MITFEKWLPYLTKEERAEYDVLQTLSLDAWAPGYDDPPIPVGGRLSRLAKEAYDRLALHEKPMNRAIFRAALGLCKSAYWETPKRGGK